MCAHRVSSFVYGVTIFCGFVSSAPLAATYDFVGALDRISVRTDLDHPGFVADTDPSRVPEVIPGLFAFAANNRATSGSFSYDENAPESPDPGYVYPHGRYLTGEVKFRLYDGSAPVDVSEVDAETNVTNNGFYGGYPQDDEADIFSIGNGDLNPKISFAVDFQGGTSTTELRNGIIYLLDRDAAVLSNEELPAVLNVAGFPDRRLNVFFTDNAPRNNRLEFILSYKISTDPGAPTSAVDVINSFRQTGQLPNEEVPGIFELPSRRNTVDVQLNVPGMPSGLTNGETFFFEDMAVIGGIRIVFDPSVAIGYTYEVSGTFFDTVEVPAVAGDNEFSLVVLDEDGNPISDVFTLAADSEFEFAENGLADVVRFLIFGIDPAAVLDPADPRAFPTLLAFTDDGFAEVRMTAISTPSGPAVVPLPSALPLMLTVVGFAIAAGRYRCRTSIG